MAIPSRKSCLRQGNSPKSSLKVSWKNSPSDKVYIRNGYKMWHGNSSSSVVNKHNSKPSKGHFYQTHLKDKSGVKYVPFAKEDLRIRTAEAFQEAKDLRKEVLDYYREFEGFEEEITSPKDRLIAEQLKVNLQSMSRSSSKDSA